MSKICSNEVEVEVIVNYYCEKGMECYIEQLGDYWLVYCISDKKIFKLINYFFVDFKSLLL